MTTPSNRHTPIQGQSDKPWLDLRHHPNKTIMKPDELEEFMKDPPPPVDDKILDHILGSMIGMALGDALGAHVEFRPHAFLLEHPVTDLQGGGTWGLKKGQFTDDTSMALCLANSLVVRRDYDPYDQLVRYKWWYREGYMSSTGKCFDIGAATRQSLMEFERRQKEFAKKYKIPPEELDFLADAERPKGFDVNCSEEGVAGNGALMRLAPVPLFFYQYPPYAVEYSGHSGEITHGDQKAIDACRYYGALIVAAVNGATKKQLLDIKFYDEHKDWFDNQPLHPDIERIARGSYQKKGGYDKGIRGKGYVVDALEAALWAFWSDKNSFKTGVLAAINLGDDTDTTAAIYGQLAGAHYGYKEIPKAWVDQVYAKDFIACLSKWIVYEGKRWSPTQPAALTIPRVIVEPTADTGSESYTGQETNSDGPATSRKTPEQRIKSPTKAPDTQSGSTATFEQPIDVTSDSRGRSRTLTEPLDTLKPGSTERFRTDRPGSAERKNAPSGSARLYLSKKIKSVDDVYEWFLSLGDDYVTYADTFKKRNIDGYWLLNYINGETLITYGVENQDHRRGILDGIEKLKENCPEKFSIEQK